MPLKVASHFMMASPGEHFNFWERGIGRLLPTKLGKADLFPNKGDKIRVVGDGYDIAYCQPWTLPDRRPAKFVYSFLSDCPGYEEQIMRWLDALRPNFVGCLQQVPVQIAAFAKERGCRMELLPWFVVDDEPECQKTIDIMCSGCIDPAVYPSRKRIFEYLSQSKFHGRAVLSCSGNFGSYRLDNESYREALAGARHYASGGIYDQWIPPKYYEVLNNGACLLSFPMPHMAECGFIDGETFIELKRLEDIDRIIDSDRWRTIGPRGREMVRSRHTAEARARRILEVYHEFAG